MFTLNSWPKKRAHTKPRSGRPVQKPPAPHIKPKTYDALDELHEKGSINEKTYKIALRYRRTWHLYLSAIQAPRVKTMQLNPLKQGANDWSDQSLTTIEEKGRHAQNILSKQGKYTRHIIDQVIAFNQPCKDIQVFTSFMENYDKES